MFILAHVSRVIGAFGVLVIVWGCAIMGWRILRSEIHRTCTAGVCSVREALRHQLGSHLLLGLEFPVASNIVWASAIQHLMK